MIGYAIGQRIVFTTNVLEETTERLFPVSKHRSRRIYKKLVKRHGGEFMKKPAIWSINGVIYAHPHFRTAIEAATKGD